VSHWPVGVPVPSVCMRSMRVAAMGVLGVVRPVVVLV
jgi:hypothetical protein